MKIVPSVLLATVASFVLVGAASAADLATVAAPVPAVPAASLENTLSLEFTPEFYATNYSGFNNTTKPSGALADDVFKLAYSHTFAGVWVLGGNVAYTKRTSYDSTDRPAPTRGGNTDSGRGYTEQGKDVRERERERRSPSSEAVIDIQEVA